ncbi:hypothetical protein FNAPI_6237 [Fusarium napiforme]|uniref:Uncharacterized protein n=1 Tax=Fusarium napiforme TaxID=42672 RepID=A0A8H5JJ15_9HYPO|nr:hypothetical protein FNAPI_6237 [Fusarium napiforme]
MSTLGRKTYRCDYPSAAASGRRGFDRTLYRVKATSSQAVITSTITVAGLTSTFATAVLEMPEDTAAVREATRLDLGPYTFPSLITAAIDMTPSPTLPLSVVSSKFVSAPSTMSFGTSSQNPTTTSIVTDIAEHAADTGTSQSTLKGPAISARR